MKTAAQEGLDMKAAEAAAIYTRISQDRDGTMLGIARQEKLCRELADRKGWIVAETYADNDLSAYSGRPRPAYQRMLADLEAGARDAVVVVDHDRLSRHPRELEEFIDLAERLKVSLANVSGDLDLATSDGQLKARIMGAVARQESQKKSERIRRQREQAAASGRPHPGPRSFGYLLDHLTPHPEEADLIRRAADNVLAGRSIRSIADEWNAKGVTTARGKRWTVGAIRDVLTAPRNAGLRVHHGEVVGAGEWEPILDREMWERLAAVAKSRKRQAGRPPTRLLSGIATCGICGFPMRSSVSRGVATYVCRRQPGAMDGACGRLSIIANYVDDEVTGRVISRLASPALTKALVSHQQDSTYRDLAARLGADEAALDQLSQDYYVQRIIGRGEFLRAREELERRMEGTRRALAANGSAGVTASLPIGKEDGLRTWWETAPPDARRSVIEAVIERVEIQPMVADRPRRFDPDRVKVTWRA